MTALITVFIIISTLYFALIIIYTIGWNRTGFFVAERFSPNTKISVVIAARNEEQNIRECLHSVLHQNYPKELFEVIVVDDHSEDKTAEIVKSLQSEFGNLMIREFDNEIAEGKSYKKEAITKGVEIAKGELIITTDADCIADKNRLQTIASFYETHQPKMIAMPIRFESGNSWLQDFQQMDLSGLIGITTGSLYWNFPVMANGGNMAFEKNAFEKVNGFSGNENIPGGDDIYLLLKIKKYFPGAVQFLKSEEVIVTTKPLSTFNEFYHQRLRWISKSGKFGDWKITAVLMCSYLFNFLLLFSLFAGIVFQAKILLIASVIIYLMKWVVEFPMVKSVSDFLNHPFSISKYLFCNILHQLYVIVFGILALVKKYEWKGRTY